MATDNPQKTPKKTAGVDWSHQYKNRKEIEKKFGKIWNIPIRKRHHHIVKDHAENNLEWLEIGAGNRALKKTIESNSSNSSYKSYDIDQRNYHDFYELDQISGQYDRICMFEIIEHVSIEEASSILQKCRNLIKPNGKLIVSTPNIYYPPAFLRDVTHITSWSYDELGGFLQVNNFSVDNIYRMYHDALLRKLVTRFFMHPLHKFLGIDYSKQIILVASPKST